MKQRQISFSPPDISEEEINEVRQALRSGLEVEEIQDNIGLGHSILQCRLK